MPPSIKAAIGLFGFATVAVVAGVGNPSNGSIAPRLTPENLVVGESKANPAGTAPSGVAVASVGAGSSPFAAPAGSTPRSVSSPAAGTAAHIYSEMVRRIARRYSVEWELVMAIIASESGGDPSAVSPAGAVGLMQLMPETAIALGVDPWDPEQNVEGAVRYLSSLLSTFGSVDLSLIAYNAGPGFAQRYREGAVELGAETRAFLIRVGHRSR